ncbi:CPBP family intramembrane glutamic endopeptidase [Candidatus Nitrospira bockiana]
MTDSEQPDAPPPAAAQAGPPLPQVRLSPAVTLFLGVILAGGIGFLVWLEATIPRLDRVLFPERALSLLVSRTLDVEEGIARLPVWERWLHQTTLVSGAESLQEAMAWYEELVHATRRPESHLELAILEAEAGGFKQVASRIDEWKTLEEPFPAYAELVEAGYLVPRIPLERGQALQARLAEALSAGWFYDRLAMSLAARSGDRSFLLALADQRQARLGPLLYRVRILSAVELAAILLGLIWLGTFLRDRAAGRVGEAPIPPPWRGRLGVAVLIRGGALGLLIAVSFLVLDVGAPIVRLLSMPAAAVPVVLLAHRHLLRAHGLGFARGFGLVPSGGRAGALVKAVAVVLAAGLIGEWVLEIIAERVKLTSHWTEWFDGDLVWGDQAVVFVTLLEFVVFAPVFEELVFRGLLFATLRRRFGWTTSAAVSAGVFAVAHGYGALGFVSVFWSGVLWAWIYERTGSLLPNMIAHGLSNLLVCLSILLLLRA